MMDGYQGQQGPESTTSEYNALVGVIQSVLRECNTSTLVRIKAVTNSGSVSPVGFVDVEPLVNLIDGSGQAIEHSVIYHCIYLRLQGGGNAIILDPQVGDIGACAFADRDISKVKSTKTKASPGSGRRFSMADGMYFGGMLNGTPTQYVQFSSAGIKVHSPTLINIDSPEVQINASTSVTITSPVIRENGFIYLDGPVAQENTSGLGTTAHIIGPLTVDNDVTATTTSLHTHKHHDPITGDTSAPI